MRRVLFTSITLLLAAACSPAAPEPEAELASSGRHVRCGTVLVVDDNLDAASVLAMMLRNAGHTVVTAHSGEEALTMGWQHEPDAVLLDIGMPDLNGYEVAGRMRITPWGRRALEARRALAREEQMAGETAAGAKPEGDDADVAARDRADSDS